MQLSEQEQVDKAVKFFVQEYGIQPSQASEEQRKQEYVRLRSVSDSLGYNSGWAFHEYRRLFGEKPPFEWKEECDEKQTKKEEVLAIQDSSTFQTQKDRVQFAEKVLGVPEKSPTSVHVAALIDEIENVEHRLADLKRAVQYLLT